MASLSRTVNKATYVSPEKVYLGVCVLYLNTIFISMDFWPVNLGGASSELLD